MYLPFKDQRSDTRLLKGLAAGLLGGLAASWVMNRFQYAVPAQAFASLLGENDAQDQESDEDDGDSQEESEPTTVRAAQALSRNLLHRDLTNAEKQWAGPAVHYSFGTSTGALYGALAEVWPSATRDLGLPFGAAYWLLADEAVVPALGLTKPPWRFATSTHVYSLTSHLVYGLTAEAVRRTVRKLID